MAFCSIIIITYNALEYTRLCYESILKYTQIPHEIIFVDNGSTDGTRDFLRRIQSSAIRLILNNENQGFAAGCNQGARAANSSAVLFLNNDTVVTKNWLNNLFCCLNSQHQIAAVVPVSNLAAGSQIPVTYRNLKEMDLFACHFNKINPAKWRQTETASGFCLLVKKPVFDVLGGFDEQFGIGFFEDTDLILRIRQAGYRVMIAGDTFVHHFGSRTYHANHISIEHWMNHNSAKFMHKHFGA
jgi:GT2 family glycosyltransferase